MRRAHGARFESRDVRSTLRAQRRPVDAAKERMRLDLFCGGVAEAAFAVAEQRPHLQKRGVWAVRRVAPCEAGERHSRAKVLRTRCSASGVNAASGGNWRVSL